MQDMDLRDMALFQDQFVYLTDEALLSNSWAGSYWITHGLPDAKLVCLGPTYQSGIIGGDKQLAYFEDGKEKWRGIFSAPMLQVVFASDQYLVLTQDSLYTFDPKILLLSKERESEALLGGHSGSRGINGYSTLGFLKGLDSLHSSLPVPSITCMAEIRGKLWFGSTKGAYMLRDEGKYNYYQGERWLPGDSVLHIAEGPENSVLILTHKGLTQLVWEPWTLERKAAFYEQQVRKRHIRHGLNASLTGLESGKLETGTLKDSDNDGLWTAMYLASQAFRYAVDSSEEARQNCRESLDAMERLFSINPVKGFPSRSFERGGYIPFLADTERWQHADDPRWDWKATTSSDEAIGHMFAYGVVAEVVKDASLQAQAIRLMDSLMTHIVENNWYLIDYDGEPTTWGRWHPDYVNARPPMVGDRKLNSSNIISMLQTAYHFTGKEIFKEKAYELMDKHGYLENLLRPMAEIGPAPDTADDWSKMLSESWNHSDDEMYFLGYWGLYRYAFTDSLKQLYKGAILDHWEAERPEKEGAWNIFTALTGVADFDREEAMWFLREYPLDLIDWNIQNSHRKDLVFVEENFRGQTTTKVLPPDERPIQRHNGNTFTLDRNRSNGSTEYSAGDIWLLPYWMGRFLGVIGGME